MDIYSLALFLHIVGALGLAVALGLEWTALRQVRSAMLPEQARPWMGVLKNSTQLGFPCMLTMVITGVYMMLAEWGWAPWIVVTMGALILLIALAGVLSRPRMGAVGQALAGEQGPLSQNFHSLANHPALWLSIQTRAAIVLGIVFIKIVKPDAAGSLLTIGVAIILGILSASPMFRPRAVQQQGAGRLGNAR